MEPVVAETFAVAAETILRIFSDRARRQARPRALAFRTRMLNSSRDADLIAARRFIEVHGDPGCALRSVWARLQGCLRASREGMQQATVVDVCLCETRDADPQTSLRFSTSPPTIHLLVCGRHSRRCCPTSVRSVWIRRTCLWSLSMRAGARLRQLLAKRVARMRKRDRCLNLATVSIGSGM
jgi:hypothetical protein